MVIFVLKIIHVLSNSIKDTERCLTFAGIFPDKVISRLPFSQMTRYSVVCVRVCARVLCHVAICFCITPSVYCLEICCQETMGAEEDTEYNNVHILGVRLLYDVLMFQHLPSLANAFYISKPLGFLLCVCVKYVSRPSFVTGLA